MKLNYFLENKENLESKIWDIKKKITKNFFKESIHYKMLYKSYNAIILILLGLGGLFAGMINLGFDVFSVLAFFPVIYFGIVENLKKEENKELKELGFDSGYLKEKKEFKADLSGLKSYLNSLDEVEMLILSKTLKNEDSKYIVKDLFKKIIEKSLYKEIVENQKEIFDYIEDNFEGKEEEYLMSIISSKIEKNKNNKRAELEKRIKESEKINDDIISIDKKIAIKSISIKN